MSAQFCIDLYTEILSRAVPIAFAFGMGNVLCNMVLNAAFGGRLSLGGEYRG